MYLQKGNENKISDNIEFKGKEKKIQRKDKVEVKKWEKERKFKNGKV